MQVRTVARGGVEPPTFDFQTTVIRSHLFAAVHDLRQKSHAAIGERRRTHANETEKETTRAPQSVGRHPQTAHYVASPSRGRGHPQGSTVSRPL
jgi:hypothetical protein